VFLAILVVFLIWFFVFANPERIARASVSSLMDQNFISVAHGLSDKISCKSSKGNALLDFATPVRCTFPTLCNKDVEVLVWANLFGVGAVGPDPFSQQVARICIATLKDEVRAVIKAKEDQGD
jgi:ABC-type dipeptide/oligopeptide/nickel transport system permease component